MVSTISLLTQALFPQVTDHYQMSIYFGPNITCFDVYFYSANDTNSIHEVSIGVIFLCTNFPFCLLQTGATPLKVASQEGHVHVVKQLLRGGASIDKMTEVMIIKSDAWHHLSCSIICVPLDTTSLFS